MRGRQQASEAPLLPVPSMRLLGHVRFLPAVKMSLGYQLCQTDREPQRCHTTLQRGVVPRMSASCFSSSSTRFSSAATRAFIAPTLKKVSFSAGASSLAA